MKLCEFVLTFWRAPKGLVRKVLCKPHLSDIVLSPCLQDRNIAWWNFIVPTGFKGPKANIVIGTHCHIPQPVLSRPSTPWAPFGGGRWQGSRSKLTLGNIQCQILLQTSALPLGSGHQVGQTFKTHQDVVCQHPVVEDDRRNPTQRSWWQHDSEGHIASAEAYRPQGALSKRGPVGFLSWCALPTWVPETSDSLLPQLSCSLTSHHHWGIPG